MITVLVYYTLRCIAHTLMFIYFTLAPIDMKQIYLQYDLPSPYSLENDRLEPLEYYLFCNVN